MFVVTFGMTSQTHYYYTKVMSDLFYKQPEVKNTEEFWEFMEGQLLGRIVISIIQGFPFQMFLD